MLRKYLVVSVTLLAFLSNVTSAMAYTSIGGSGVFITASGEIAGNTVALTASVVDQTTGTDAGTALSFPANPVGRTNSQKALKVTGGTNVVGARIIIATDNNTLFTDSAQDPRGVRTGATFTKYSGVDGAGMVGASAQGYVVPLIWGMTDTPNTRPTSYTFAAAPNANWSYIVDTWHKHDFVTQGLIDGVNASLGSSYTIDQIDTMTLYKTDGTSVANTASEGSGIDKKLVPTLFSEDLWSTAVPSTRQLIRQALYKNIGTVAYGIQVGVDVDAGYYICQVPKLSTPADSGDSITVRLKKIGTGTDEFLYVPIGADFAGMPAQQYSTSKLFVMMVQD